MNVALPTLQDQLKDVTTKWSASVATGHQPPIEAAELMTQFLSGYGDQLKLLGNAINERLDGLKAALTGVDTALFPMLTGEGDEDPALLSQSLMDCVGNVHALADLATELTGEVEKIQ